MRLPKTTHTSRPWQVHELTEDFELDDVPFRPSQRPESITRFAISFAFSGSPAARRTSIATCLADTRFAVVCFAIVTSFSSSLLARRGR